MDSGLHIGDISELLLLGFQKARLKFLKEEAGKDGTVIICDKNGHIKKVPAKELLSAAENKAR